MWDTMSKLYPLSAYRKLCSVVQQERVSRRNVYLAESQDGEERQGGGLGKHCGRHHISTFKYTIHKQRSGIIIFILKHFNGNAEDGSVKRK